MEQTQEKTYSLDELTGGDNDPWVHFVVDKDARPMMSLCGIQLDARTFCPSGSPEWHAQIKQICPDCHFIAKSRKL